MLLKYCKFDYKMIKKLQKNKTNKKCCIAFDFLFKIQLL